MLKYEATVCGKVLRNGKEAALFPHHTGYLCVSIRNKQWRVHKFVWVYFNGDVPSGYCINHKNGIKTDNRLENLECVTFKENTQHAYATGLMKGQTGESNSMSKLSNEQVYDLFSKLHTHSNTQIGQMFNLHSRYVSLIRHKRRWKDLWKQYEGSETMAEVSREEVLSKRPVPSGE